MKRVHVIIIAGLLLICGVWQTSIVQARPHATYALMKSSLNPGSRNSARIYTIASSIGQPDAGEVSVGIYTLGGGFWGGGVIVPAIGNYQLFLPLMVK